MTTRTHRVRAAVIAGLAVVTFPLMTAAGCENEGDDSPGVEQNDDGGDDDGGDDDGGDDDGGDDDGDG